MGANAGAIVSLADGTHGFGRHWDNDVVLADDAVADRHAVVEIAGRCAVLVPLVPGTQLANRALDAGKARPLRDGADLVLGDTRLRFHGPQGGWRDRARMHLPWAGLAAACVVATLSLVPLHLSATTTPQLGDRASVAQRTASGQADSRDTLPLHEAAGRDATRRETGAKRVALARALTLLQGRLADARLDGLVEVAGAEGAVLATGALKPADRDRWLAIQMWFDSAVQDHVTLVDKVGNAQVEDVPRLDIRAVSMGAVPFVITGSGDRYAEGAILAGGWTIGRIAAERVTLLNGSRSLDITL